MITASAVATFARLPAPGTVKTRLIGRLTAPQAASVHRACLEDTVRLLGSLACCDRSLWVAGPSDGAQEFAATLGLTGHWQVCVQRGRDLGARLEQAFGLLFTQGARKVAVVGTDTPWMARARIQLALRLLDTTDAVLGPTRDGGYYLVGARRLVPEMFRRIPWGTRLVLPITLRRLSAAHASFRLLPWDFDLDTPQDLARVSELLEQKKVTAPALARLLERLANATVH